MDARHRILLAMAELVEDTPLDKVAVADICEHAGISRQTFYRHFRDKYEVSTWYFDGVVEQTCRQIGKTMGWRSAYLSFFRLMESNRTFHRRLVESNDYNAVAQESKRSLARTFEERYRRTVSPEIPPLIRFQISSFAKIDVDTITEWLAGGCEPPADEFVDLFCSLIPRELFRTFDMPDEGPRNLMFLML